MQSKPRSARRDGSMKRAIQFRLLTAFWGITALCSLVLMPDEASAKTIKGHIVDVGAENIGNITETIRTDSGETTKFKDTDWRLTANLHFNEPVSDEEDDEGTAKGITCECQTQFYEHS